MEKQLVMKHLVILFLFLINNGNSIFIKTDYIKITPYKTVISFNKDNNYVSVSEFLGGITNSILCSFSQKNDTIFLYNNEGLIFNKYKVIKEDILYSVDDSTYVIPLKLYNKKYKNKILVKYPNKQKMVKIKHLSQKENMIFVDRKKAMNKYGIDGLNGLLITE